MTPPRTPGGRVRSGEYLGAEGIPQPPQTTPSAPGYGLHSHDFTLQAVMELQKSVGEMNANIGAMKSSMDGMKSKVEDLVGWKNKVLGGAAVLLFIGGLLGWGITKFSSYVELKQPPATTQPAPTEPAHKPSSVK